MPHRVYDPIALYDAELGRRFDPHHLNKMSNLELALLQIAKDEDFYEVAFLGQGMRGIDSSVDRLLTGASDTREIATTKNGVRYISDVVVVQYLGESNWETKEM